jgi:aminopeptidase N
MTENYEARRLAERAKKYNTQELVLELESAIGERDLRLHQARTMGSVSPYTALERLELRMQIAAARAELRRRGVTAEQADKLRVTNGGRIL